jgi:hypothetical protein
MARKMQELQATYVNYTMLDIEPNDTIREFICMADIKRRYQRAHTTVRRWQEERLLNVFILKQNPSKAYYKITEIENLAKNKQKRERKRLPLLNQPVKKPVAKEKVKSLQSEYSHDIYQPIKEKNGKVYKFVPNRFSCYDSWNIGKQC